MAIKVKNSFDCVSYVLFIDAKKMSGVAMASNKGVASGKASNVGGIACPRNSKFVGDNFELSQGLGEPGYYMCSGNYGCTEVSFICDYQSKKFV